MFARALKLLFRNPKIVLLAAIAGAVGGWLTVRLQTPAPKDYASAYVAAFTAETDALVQGLFVGLASLVTIGFGTPMAAIAWKNGTASSGDGWRAFRHDAWKLFVLLVALLILGAVAVWLSTYTFGVALLAYAFFFCYAPAAVAVHGVPAHRALFESGAVALHHAVKTLSVILAMAIVGLLVTFGVALAVRPLLGVGVPIAVAVVVQVLLAYFTFVIVGEYVALRPAPASASNG